MKTNKLYLQRLFEILFFFVYIPPKKKVSVVLKKITTKQKREYQKAMSWQDVREAVLSCNISKLLTLEPFVVGCQSQRLQKTALHLAIQHNVMQSFDFLVTHCTRLLQRIDVKEESALDYAISHNRLIMIEKLVRLRPTLMQHYSSIRHTQTIEQTIIAGNMDALKIMLTAHPAAISFVSCREKTLLHFAVSAQAQKLDVLRYLLSLSPQDVIFMRCHSGDSVLHSAVRQHKLEAVQLIYKTEPQSAWLIDHQGRTPFALAVEETCLPIVNFLLYVQPTLIEALHTFDNHVIFRVRNLAMLQKLLQVNPSLIEMTDRNGDSLLHRAVDDQNRSLVEFLVVTKPDLVFQKNVAEQTPLQRALHGNDFVVVKTILNSCPNVQQVDKDDNTLLHNATRLCKLDILRAIYANDPFSLTSINNNGETPFAIAAKRANWTAIKLFLPNTIIEMIASTKNCSIYSNLVALVKSRFFALEQKLLPELIGIVFDMLEL